MRFSSILESKWKFLQFILYLVCALEYSTHSFACSKGSRTTVGNKEMRLINLWSINVWGTRCVSWGSRDRIIKNDRQKYELYQRASKWNRKQDLADARGCNRYGTHFCKFTLLLWLYWKTQFKFFSHSSFLVFYYIDSPSLDCLRFRFFQATCWNTCYFNPGYRIQWTCDLYVIFTTNSMLYILFMFCCFTII